MQLCPGCMALQAVLHVQGVVVFLFVAVLKVQPGTGLQQGAKKLGEAFLSAWALSQLTKVPRALGCVAMASPVCSAHSSCCGVTVQLHVCTCQLQLCLNL